jgi:UDP-N-acetylglucosamine--N-acetylmuramyl-(pentapeptide) pyrophosphoryl-undecaprenol N-acetylglucosamine transferase
MEMEKVPAAGYEIIGLDIQGIQRSLSLANLAVPFKLINSVRKSISIITDFKPHVAVGVGGYASGPLLLACALRGIPYLIQEQNSYAGITNKWLGKWAKKVCVAYPGMERFFAPEKISITGNPVRQDILDIDRKHENGIELFGLDHTRKTVLVMGGSLGALTINKTIESLLPEFAERGIQLVWQTGRGYFNRAKEAVKPYEGNGIRAVEFIQRMDYAYALADIIVSRAGASSISELCIVGKPAILIPSPNVTEDHQTQNAMALVSKDAAVMVADGDVYNQLSTVIYNLFANPTHMQTLSNNIKDLAMPYADKDIAYQVIKLAKIS